MTRNFHQPAPIPTQALLLAYCEGYFPMGDPETGEVHWYRPQIRGIVPLDQPPRVPRSLMKIIRRRPFEIMADRAFEQVIRACAAPRWWKGLAWKRPAGPTAAGVIAEPVEGPARPTDRTAAAPAGVAPEVPAFANDTWLTESLVEAYTRIHHLGFAHSVEAWREGRLVGGLYGVALGSAFFGESMFVRPQDGGTDASKICLVALIAHLRSRGFTLLDAQMMTEHLERFGCRPIGDRPYRQILNMALARQDVTWDGFDAEALLAPYRRPGRRPTGITGG